MNGLATALMAWIAANSTYDTAIMPIPEIVLMTPIELTAEAYSDTPDLIPDSRVDDRVLALYSFEDGANGTVYLLAPEQPNILVDPEELSEFDPLFEERLLHELVHHVQRMSGAYDAFPCRNFGELQAYQLGGSYLRQRNVEDPLPNRNFRAHIYSRC